MKEKTAYYIIPIGGKFFVFYEGFSMRKFATEGEAYDYINENIMGEGLCR